MWRCTTLPVARVTVRRMGRTCSCRLDMADHARHTASYSSDFAARIAEHRIHAFALQALRMI